ncbi:MAG: DUF520 family protein, partial [Myxococcales bacterium]|nr:DUF520 family protein [Myxococcales bacterium]
RDTETALELADEQITVRSSSEERAKAAVTVLREKLVKRKVSLKFFDEGKPEPTGKGGSKITLAIQEGIATDKARPIVAAIKDSKLKVQASMQDAQVRVTGKNKDDLQKAMQVVRGLDLGIEISFTNFRD